MKWTAWRALGLAVAAVGAGAVARLSAVSGDGASPDQGLIRLSWRALGEQVRVCRRLAPEELAKLPAHMRQEEVCTRHILPSHLRVWIDSGLVLDDTVRAGGAREDRPLFVFVELPIARGRHRIDVAFERLAGGEPYRESEEDPEHETRETPPVLVLHDTIRIESREIVLITYDDEERKLRRVSGGEAR
ncbi:MAG TPA: hypothetical protein VJ755_03575 [Gemmatimonadales bacterium]|nr:hypothetical protein [Gemmatimonadales bacterium]